MCRQLSCPSCSGPMTQRDLKDVLSPGEMELFTKAALEEAIAANASFVRCPASGCGLVVERVNTTPARLRLPVGPEVPRVVGGVELSEDARRHYRENRFSCRGCRGDFCASCGVHPYHVGLGCEDFRRFKDALRCRFCDSAISVPDMVVAAADPPSLVCSAAECQLRKSFACCKVHPSCGHICRGIKDERDCLQCLEPGCHEAHQRAPDDPPSAATAAAAPGASSSVVATAPDASLSVCGDDFCSICWTEPLKASPAIKLRCGHIFHFSCVRDKLEKRWTGVRITFSFAECPLCSREIYHPSLTTQLGVVNRVRAQVEAKSLERLQYENEGNLTALVALTDPASRFFNKPSQYAMHIYSYYPCFRCGTPYYAGQAACDRQNPDQEFDPSELVCGGCTASSSAAAKSCPKHGKDYIMFKCRYCCNPASWYCWSSSHFCNQCHEKAATIARKDKKSLPKCSCKIKHPPNGEEFAYGCSLCVAIANF